MGYQTPYTSKQPVTDFGLPFSSLKFSALLAANTEATLTIPGLGAAPQVGMIPRYKAILISSPNVEVFIALNETAEVPLAPVGAMLNATTSELIPVIGTAREVRAGEVLHFISADANAPISVILYALDITG